MLEKCRHENIVSYYGALSKGRHMWIAMEYCAGGSASQM